MAKFNLSTEKLSFIRFLFKKKKKTKPKVPTLDIVLPFGQVNLACDGRNVNF